MMLPCWAGRLRQRCGLSCAIFFALTCTTMHAQAHAPARKPAGADGLANPRPTGPVVVIDTTLGRITCSLYSQQAPNTAANFVALATGSKDWTDAAAGTPMHGKPFYDGVGIFGISDGITSGDRLGGNKGVAGAPFPAEKSGLGFDRPGRLIMARAPAANPADKSAPELTSSSVFYISAYADAEYTRRGGTVFGQCDDASLPVVRDLAHTLLASDNHPAPPLAINHIAVLKPGDPLPPIADAVPVAEITPQAAPIVAPIVPAPEPTGPSAVIVVTRAGKPLGQFSCRLFAEEAPLATANFIGLVNGTKDWTSPATHAVMHGRRFYDGLSFGRVIPDFMIQNADMPGDPQGGGQIGFKFANEIVPGLSFDRPGRLAMANSGPGTNGSEFFITEHAIRRLDGNYTIFGQCDDASVKLVETIARTPRDLHNKPLVPVVIRTITILPAKR